MDAKFERQLFLIFFAFFGKFFNGYFLPIASLGITFSRTLCCNWVKAGARQKAFRKWTLVLLIGREKVEIQIHFSKVSMEPVILDQLLAGKEQREEIQKHQYVILNLGSGSIC